FSEDVAASVSESDLVLENLTAATTVPTAFVDVDYDSGTNTARFTFPGYSGGVLPDGSYRATIAAGSIQDAGGNTMAADFKYYLIWSSGTGGSDLYIIKLDAPGTTVQVFMNNPVVPMFTATYSTLGIIAIDGDADDDSATVDLVHGNPIPPDGIHFDGAADSDTLGIVGTTGAQTAAANSGSLDISGAGSIGHANVETVSFDGLGGFDSLTISSAPPVIFPGTQQFQSLTLAAGTSAALSSNGNRVLVVKALSLDASASLDLFDNDLILDYTDTRSAALDAIQALINSARNFGEWDGPGLTSTVARDNPDANTTLGAMDASDYLGYYGPGTLFAGQSIDATSVIVKYTYYGDANFDGQITLDDYSQIDGGYLLNLTGWLNGDFDGSGGKVDLDDYSLIDGAFLTQGAVL
ncbi:MAG: hypothetical protein ACREJC_04160, partial [Tepidisphaeraceae bacterium]